MHQMNNIEKMSEGSTICVIASGTERYSSILREYEVWDEYERIRISKNISVRYIGSESQKDTLQKRKLQEKDLEYCILPGHATGLMNTDIWDDHVTINIFGNPTLSITVSGKEITDGYRQFFEALWKLGKIN